LNPGKLEKPQEMLIHALFPAARYAMDDSEPNGQSETAWICRKNSEIKDIYRPIIGKGVYAIFTSFYPNSICVILSGIDSLRHPHYKPRRPDFSRLSIGLFFLIPLILSRSE